MKTDCTFSTPAQPPPHPRVTVCLGNYCARSLNSFRQNIQSRAK